MSNRIKVLLGAGITALGTLGTFAVTHAQALTTSTLGTAIDTVNSTWYDYVTVFLTHAWPFIVGAIVLAGIIYFGIRLISRIFKG